MYYVLENKLLLLLLLLLLGQKRLVFKINSWTAEKIVLFSESDKLAFPYKSIFNEGWQ